MAEYAFHSDVLPFLLCTLRSAFHRERDVVRVDMRNKPRSVQGCSVVVFCKYVFRFVTRLLYFLKKQSVSLWRRVIFILE